MLPGPQNAPHSGEKPPQTFDGLGAPHVGAVLALSIAPLNLRHMFEFCIPTRSTSVPDTPDWLHEIKYDGYRLRLERNGDRVRLITRGGYDWTDR